MEKKQKKETSKCSNRNLEVQLPVLFGKFDRPTDHPTDGHVGHWKVKLPISETILMVIYITFRKLHYFCILQKSDNRL